MNIHPIFHISFLKPALPRALAAFITEIQPINPNAKYKIETILDYQYFHSTIKYLIK